MSPIPILLKLHSGYGLGDAVQITSVLRHLAKNRPQWDIYYQADAGYHDAAIGLVKHAFSYDEPAPNVEFDRTIEVKLYDTFSAWPDRPNTRVTSCLHERFGMGWDKECGRYVINVTEEAKWSTGMLLRYLFQSRKTPNVVCIHYEGISSPEKKNLSHKQAIEICRHIEELGRKPLLLDWQGKSPICSEGGIKSVAHVDIERPNADAGVGKSAQVNAAIISQCEAFIGIDSGPGKCAAATDTPTLICWTGHHPALFHDPSPNTTHLVPANHRQMDLLQGNAAVADWFEANYLWTPYTDLVGEVKEWLRRTLK